MCCGDLTQNLSYGMCCYRGTIREGLGSCRKLHMSPDGSLGGGVIWGPVMTWLASLGLDWGNWLAVALGTYHGRGLMRAVSWWSWPADQGGPTLQPLAGILTMPALWRISLLLLFGGLQLPLLDVLGVWCCAGNS